MIVINKISVTEALKKIEKGESLDTYEVDFENVKIEALNAFKLGKAGIDVPESVIYYDDEDIAYDPEFDDYEWERTDIDPLTLLEEQITVNINIEKNIKEWIQKNDIDMKPLLEELVRNFYSTQQLVNKESKVA